MFWIIRNRLEPNLYWSRSYGWTDTDYDIFRSYGWADTDYDIFYFADKDSVNLPIDGEWIEYK